MSRIERYIARAKGAGMPSDQLRNFLRAKIILQERQLLASAAARLCDRPCVHGPDDKCGPECAPTAIGYGGARGGGKSHWGLGQVVADDMTRFPGLKFLYLRKVGKAGKEAVTDLRRDVLHSVPHTWHAADNMISLPNGSRCILGHFQSEKDIDNYLGLQYDGALVEEATQLTRRKVTDIATCVRTAKPGWRPRMYYTTNPGNIGHAWFKEMFIAPLRRGAETETRFIQATVKDNRFVNTEYRANLEALTGWQRRAWLEGDWDIAAGQYFSTWRADHHVATFEAQHHWDYWIGTDYGFTHHTYCCLLARDGDGNIYVIDEHYGQRTQPGVHCELIVAMLARYGLEPWSLIARVAGHDFWTPDMLGGSVADAYAAGGLHFTPARIDRIAGAQEILRRLADPSGEPARGGTLIIHTRCERLIETIPTLIHNPNRPEDVLKVDCDEDGKGGDDAYDGFRYALMQAAAGDVGRGASARPREGVARDAVNPFLRQPGA